MCENSVQLSQKYRLSKRRACSKCHNIQGAVISCCFLCHPLHVYILMFCLIARSLPLLFPRKVAHKGKRDRKEIKSGVCWPEVTSDAYALLAHAFPSLPSAEKAFCQTCAKIQEEAWPQILKSGCMPLYLVLCLHTGLIPWVLSCSALSILLPCM